MIAMLLFSSAIMNIFLIFLTLVFLTCGFFTLFNDAIAVA